MHYEVEDESSDVQIILPSHNSPSKKSTIANMGESSAQKNAHDISIHSMALSIYDPNDENVLNQAKAFQVAKIDPAMLALTDIDAVTSEFYTGKAKHYQRQLSFMNTPSTAIEINKLDLSMRCVRHLITLKSIKHFFPKPADFDHKLQKLEDEAVKSIKDQIKALVASEDSPGDFQSNLDMFVLCFMLKSEVIPAQMSLVELVQLIEGQLINAISKNESSLSHEMLAEIVLAMHVHQSLN